jgi:uncharacterized cupin superfamily protein
MTIPNVCDVEFEYDPEDPPGYRSGSARVGKAAGGQEQSVKLFEIPAGEALCPFHYEYTEEWLVLLDGELDLRTPSGSERIVKGAVVCFPPGPDGGHKTTNPGPDTARLLMWSSSREPAVAVYPDSDKIGVWPGNDADKIMVRRADAPTARSPTTTVRQPKSKPNQTPAVRRSGASLLRSEFT